VTARFQRLDPLVSSLNNKRILHFKSSKSHSSSEVIHCLGFLEPRMPQKFLVVPRYHNLPPLLLAVLSSSLLLNEPQTILIPHLHMFEDTSKYHHRRLLPVDEVFAFSPSPPFPHVLVLIIHHPHVTCQSR
jgi:hypothetical protein